MESPFSCGALSRGPLKAVDYRIQAGDTVYSVARRFAVPVRGVIDANALRPPYGLRVGQVLEVPNPRRHRVQAGDTVDGVARRYGIDRSALIRINGIEPPHTIKVGQFLRLPAPTEVAAAGPAPVVSVKPDVAAPPPIVVMLTGSV